MAQGFTLVYDPEVTVYRKVKIASGTAIFQGTVLDRNRGSATVDAAVATASSTTSSIYGVAVSSASSTDTTILMALITPRQLWQVDCGASGGGTANTAHNGQRMIFGTQTITLSQNVSTLGANGVVNFAIGATFNNNTTVNNTGSDVTGTTGVFEQIGTDPLVSTSRVVGRLLSEHAA